MGKRSQRVPVSADISISLKIEEETFRGGALSLAPAKRGGGEKEKRKKKGGDVAQVQKLDVCELLLLHTPSSCPSHFLPSPLLLSLITL